MFTEVLQVMPLDVAGVCRYGSLFCLRVLNVSLLAKRSNCPCEVHDISMARKLMVRHSDRIIPEDTSLRRTHISLLSTQAPNMTHALTHPYLEVLTPSPSTKRTRILDSHPTQLIVSLGLNLFSQIAEELHTHCTFRRTQRQQKDSRATVKVDNIRDCHAGR